MTTSNIEIRFPATVAQDIQILGLFRIVIDSHAVIHAKAVLDATFGPITIGSYSIIRCAHLCLPI